MENRKSCCLRMAPEVRKLCKHKTRCLRLTQLGGLSLSAYLDMRAIAVRRAVVAVASARAALLPSAAAAAGRGDP